MSSDRSRTAGRRPLLPLSVSLFVAIAAAYIAIGPALRPGGMVSEGPGGFYGLLTEAFLLGQTHLNVEPDPRLATLEDPWSGYSGVERMHDATYFNGRYYLYFGPGPAVLLGIPWLLATGTYLNDGAMTTLFGVFSLLIATVILHRAWMRWFSNSPQWIYILGLLCYGFGNYLFPILASQAFYPVPITCAHGCALLAALSVMLALEQNGTRGAIFWMAVASLSWGAAVASRPTYVLGLPALLIPILMLARRIGDPGETSVNFRAVAVASAGILPAGVIGLFLAWYNYARFGDITEFGWHYQFAGASQLEASVFDAGRLSQNLMHYFAGIPNYSLYFPFTISPDGSWGALFTTPFTVIGLIGSALLLAKRHRVDAAWTGIIAVLGIGALGNLAGVLTLSIHSERYGIDALPLALVAGILWGFRLATRPQSRISRGVQLGIFCVFAATTIPNGAIAGLSRCEHRPFLPGVQRLSFRFADFVERIVGIQHGPLTLSLRFANFETNATDPLLVTGLGRDVLNVRYTSETTGVISYQNTGAGGPVSREFELKPGQVRELRIDMGSLYPPDQHPMFDRWPAESIARVRKTCEISIDGEVVLRTGGNFFPSDPADRHVGSNPYGWASGPKFSGQILGVWQSTPHDATAVEGRQVRGPVMFDLNLPEYRAYSHQPLVSTGVPGEGDLVFITLVGPNQIRIGHDHWGAGSVEGPLIELNPVIPHRFVIDMASLHPGSQSGVDVGNLRVSINGKLGFDQPRPFHRSPIPIADIGFNFVGSTKATAVFNGGISNVRWANEPADGKQVGVIRFQMRVPEGNTGVREPLVTVGPPGSADIVFIHYLSPTEVSIGHDKWGVGSIQSNALAIEPGAFHEVVVDMDALHDHKTGRPVSVSINGTTVLLSNLSSHDPNANSTVAIGENRIGASTCNPRFTGEIYWVERVEDPANARLNPPEI